MNVHAHKTKYATGGDVRRLVIVVAAAVALVTGVAEAEPTRLRIQ
jgi:hypothetical protein